jgi:tetratricopeptide (TPR) repeat protein
MSSYSRNSRKPTRAAQLACAAALLAGSTAYAADQPHSFALTAFSNTTAGTSLVHGHYETALAQLAIDAHTLERTSVSTNRCVAYTAMNELKAAREACDAAVLDAQRELATLPVGMIWARPDYRDYLAVAYSNRAVLNWLSKDSAAARADLDKAAAVSPKSEFVVRNLTALQSRNAVAQVSVAPKS